MCRQPLFPADSVVTTPTGPALVCLHQPPALFADAQIHSLLAACCCSMCQPVPCCCHCDATPNVATGTVVPVPVRVPASTSPTAVKPMVSSDGDQAVHCTLTVLGGDGGVLQQAGISCNGPTNASVFLNSTHLWGVPRQVHWGQAD